MASEDKCFTFIWKLENPSFCLEKNALPIRSPAFVVDSIGKTKWQLHIYFRGSKNYENYVSLFIFRKPESEGDEVVAIKYELAFIAENSSVLAPNKIGACNFPKGSYDGEDKFIKREDLFITKRSTFLPQDTLTVRCRLWKFVGKMTEDVRCFARTRIGVQKSSFLWNIENCSTLEFGQKYTYEMKSLDLEKQFMSVNLSLTEGLSSEEIICFELNLEDQAIKFSTLLLSLVDVSGKRIECNRDEFWFDDGSKCKEFKFFFTKNKLMAMKSVYLPNDILSLYFDWTFSRGIVSEEIEDVQYASTGPTKKCSDAPNLNNENKAMTFSYPLGDNLKSLYDENFLCDVKLKTSTQTFNAHKVILSASSSVFKAMFSRDMKEKDSNCVNIEDLRDDTISQMLAYIYTTCIEDLTWETSSLLYAASDKYAIFSLKNICSSYMKDNLSPSKACEALLLSEYHADSDLKSAVQDFILKNVKDTVNSDGWKLLMETNTKLAAETLSLPYK